MKRKIILLFLALLCLLVPVSCRRTKTPAASGSGETPLTEETKTDGFLPVLRFAVTSDIHTRVLSESAATADEIRVTAMRTERLFSSTYRYAESQKYKGVDAVIVAGDYTDAGSVAQYESFFSVVRENLRSETALLGCLGNHEYRDPGDSGERNTNVSLTYARFARYFGYAADSVNEIAGYTFIGVSADICGGRGISRAKADWLDAEIAAAAAKDPTGEKPIFVFGHLPASQTSLGSFLTAGGEDGYDVSALDEVLKKYPQVVFMAGHTHAPTMDPESIYQKDYTAINTGTLCNGDYPIHTGTGKTVTNGVAIGSSGGYQKTYNEHNDREADVFMIMEVDADNRLRILYYNADADCLVGEPVIIDSIGRPEDFTFTKARAAASEAPRFEEEPTVVSLSSSSLVVGIPNAVCRDYVRNYRVDLFRDGKLEKTVYRLAAQDRLPGDVFITASFPGLLPEEEYLVNIYAYNAYGKMSDAVSLTVRTPAEAADPSPDVFRLDLLSGAGRDGIALSDLGTVGTPTVLYAAATGQNIAVFDGDDALAFPGLSTYTDLLSAGFSLEVTGRIASVPTGGEVAVVSAEAAGGFALTYRSDGKMYAKVYTKANSYLECGAAVFPGTVFHATVTYDGKTLRLYLDGEEAASAAKAKTTAVFFPLKENCRRLVIGGAPMSGGETRPSFRGTISAVNVYSMPLSADAVRAKAAAALS